MNYSTKTTSNFTLYPSVISEGLNIQLIYHALFPHVDLQDYISDLANVIQKEDSEEFVLECVGILGNLTITDLDYELLLREYNMVPWIKNRLQPGAYIL